MSTNQMLLKPGDEVYVRLHKGYKLPGKVSKKLGNQRCGPFPVVRRVGLLAYELKLPDRWKIHPVICETSKLIVSKGYYKEIFPFLIRYGLIAVFEREGKPL